jgi:2-amino-4-hydroxy-6-hydroxymethyldihydropteridine diphosphokinase
VTRMVISLGSNIDPRTNLAAAVAAIARRFDLRAVSPTYRTAPVGEADQPDFWNLAVEIDAEEPPTEVQADLHRIEDELGRHRDPLHPYGPRAIDLDLVLVEGVAGTVGGLELPSPLLAREAFVALPVADLLPRLPHPTLSVPMAEVARRALAACERPPRLLPGERLDA